MLVSALNRSKLQLALADVEALLVSPTNQSRTFTQVYQKNRAKFAKVFKLIDLDVSKSSMDTIASYFLPHVNNDTGEEFTVGLIRHFNFPTKGSSYSLEERFAHLTTYVLGLVEEIESATTVYKNENNLNQ